jgi:ribonuclease HI
MSETSARISTDGAARGNPGPAAWAYTIVIPGRPPIEAAGAFGTATNNVAEYTALIQALKRALELEIGKVEVRSDSELMVKQLNGEYAVKNADLRGLFDEVQSLRRRFSSASIAHIRRADNQRADELCNAALDQRHPNGKKPTSRSKRQPGKSVRRDDVDHSAVECLREAARAWAGSGGKNPPPELVWDQLWSILIEAGIVKTTR